MARVLGPNRPGESGWREFFYRAADWMPEPVITPSPSPINFAGTQAPRPQRPQPVRPPQRTFPPLQPAQPAQPTAPPERSWIPPVTFAEHIEHFRRESTAVPAALVIAATYLGSTPTGGLLSLVLGLVGIGWGISRAVDTDRPYAFVDVIALVVLMAVGSVNAFTTLLALAGAFGWSSLRAAQLDPGDVDLPPRDVGGAGGGPLPAPPPMPPPAPPRPRPVAPKPTPRPAAPTAKQIAEARDKQVRDVKAVTRSSGYAGLSGYFGKNFPHNISRLAVGAAAEERVGLLLERELPDEFTVAHDLTVLKNGRTSANIDHLVSGPTGVVVVDTKSWAGGTMLRADGTLSDIAKYNSGDSDTAEIRAELRNRAVETLLYIRGQITSARGAHIVIAVDGDVRGDALVVDTDEGPVHVVTAQLVSRYIASSLPAARKTPDLGRVIEGTRNVCFDDPNGDAPGWTARKRR